MERISFGRTIFSGLGGGIAMNVVILLTFRLIGFGLHGEGILLNSSFQSHKLIAVWRELEPIPLALSHPFAIMFGFLLFGVIHAFIYRWLSPAWPTGVVRCGWRLGILIFILSFLFFEFFTPFNMFGEPIPLIGLELFFWVLVAFTEAFVIAGLA